MPDLLPAQSGILDPNNPLAFAFGGNTGTPSYQELLRRRAIATAIAGQKRAFPKNIGEGIASLGEAVGERMSDARLTAQERAFGAAEDVGKAGVTAAPTVGAVSPRVVPGVAPRADVVDPAVARTNIAALITPGGPGVPQPNPTVSEGNVPPTMTATSAPQAGGLPPDDDGMWPARMSGIGGIETGGEKDPYRTIGKADTKYGKALGRYGVMTANVPAWTKAALGVALTPEQYLANDKAQDAVFKHRFGGYVARFGEEGAARAWFGGAGNVNKPHLTDAYERLSIGDYGKDYLKRLQGASPTPSGGAPAGDDTDIGSVMTVDSQTGVSPDENPPTPTTIRPMTAGGPTGSRVTSTAMPGDTPIPPASVQTMDPPGPKPVPPPRVDFSPRQQKASELMNSRNVSPETKAWAEHQFNMEEKVRTEMMQRREADYTHERGLWDAYKKDYDKFVREAPDRDIKQLNDRLSAMKTQHEVNVMQPLEAQLKAAEVNRQPDVAAKLKEDINNARADHEKKQYEVTQRAMTERKAAADTEKAEQGVVAGTPPHTTKVGDVEMQWDQATRSWKPIPQPPQQVDETGRPTGKLSAEQDKLLDHHGKASLALEQFNRIPDADKILAEGLRNEIAGKIPFFGNAALENRYRTVRNAANNFLVAHLRRTSGAVIGPEEMLQHHRDLIPIWGDDAATVKNKREMRANIVEGMYTSLGTARPHADYVRKQRQQSDLAEQAKIADEMKGVGTPEVGKIYQKGKQRRYWTGSRWEED
jgi:hypothetical protein